MSSTMLPIALLALLPLAAATVEFAGNVPSSVTFGTTFTIQWTTDAKPVKITLNGADNYALIDVICEGEWINNDMTKACSSNNTSVQYTPNDTVPEGRYNFLATDASGNTDSSNYISIAKGNGPSTLSSDSSTATTTRSTSATAATTGTTTSGSSQTSASSTSSSSPTTSGDSSQSTGLGTGAKAGVGIGAAIGGIALLSGLGFLFFRMGKKAAANKDKKKEDASAVEEGDVAAEEKTGAAGVAGAAAAGARTDDDEKDVGPAEMAAPEFIHEAPDYKLRLDSPGGKEFFSELDATGGSFMLPSSRPSTAAGGIDPNSAFNKRIGGPADEERPVTPSITVTAPEADRSGAAAKTATSPGGKSVDSMGAGSTAPSETTTAVGSPDRTEGPSAAVAKADVSEGASTTNPDAETPDTDATASETTPTTTTKEETKQ